jgi:hypothetical protein
MHSIKKGIQLVKNKRYFTIWAYRQTGESACLFLFFQRLENTGYQVRNTNQKQKTCARPLILFSFLSYYLKLM